MVPKRITVIFSPKANPNSFPLNQRAIALFVTSKAASEPKPNTILPMSITANDFPAPREVMSEPSSISKT